MFYVFCGLTLISIIATALLAHVVLNYVDHREQVQTDRSRKVEYFLLGFMIVVNITLIALIRASYGA